MFRSASCLGDGDRDATAALTEYYLESGTPPEGMKPVGQGGAV